MRISGRDVLGENESSDLRSSRRLAIAPTQHFSVMLFEANNSDVSTV